MKFEKKPKIRLVGGCASSFAGEDTAVRARNSEADEQENNPYNIGVAGTLLEGFLRTIIRALDASAGVVRVVSPDGLVFRTIGCSGLMDKVCQSECVVDAGCGVCGKSARSGTVEYSDADYCRSRFGNVFFGEACRFVVSTSLCEGDCADQPEGVLTLFYAAEFAMTDEYERKLKSYADLIRQTLGQVWHSEDKHQQDLLAERQSIANEIHDSLAQTLYFAKMRSSLLLDAMKSDNELLAFKCAQDVEEALDSSQKTVRELVTHFRCQMDPRGLKFALEKLVNDFVVRTSIALEYENGVEEFNLNDESELQVFLIIREALVNIATHSGAKMARLSIRLDGSQFSFIVEDDGAGVGSEVAPEGHYGLAIMRERALRIGGEVEVESLQGQGTQVRLVFNVPETEQAG